MGRTFLARRSGFSSETFQMPRTALAAFPSYQRFEEKKREKISQSLFFMNIFRLPFAMAMTFTINSCVAFLYGYFRFRLTARFISHVRRKYAPCSDITYTRSHSQLNVRGQDQCRIEHWQRFQLFVDHFYIIDPLSPYCLTSHDPREGQRSTGQVSEL